MGFSEHQRRARRSEAGSPKGPVRSEQAGIPFATTRFFIFWQTDFMI